MKSVVQTIKRYCLAASITWTHRKTGIFDPEWYLLRYPDVRESGMNPWWHFAMYGVYEGRVPHGAINVVHREYLSGDLSELKGLIPRHLPSEPPVIELDSSGNKPVAIVVSGEPDTPGHVFRVRRLVEALEFLGYECHQFDAWSAPQSITGTSNVTLLWIWRCEHSSRLLQLLQSARSLGVTVFYDLDDLMFDPELATPKFIDAIRSGKYEAGAVAACYSRIRDLMLCADALSASTRPLAAAMRAHFRPVVEVPNGFDQAMFDAAQKACGCCEREAGDNLIRIGYASGTLTHQRDFR